jgi:membrane fusion protein (multidrug efflux system)
VEEKPMKRRSLIGSVLLLLAVVGVGAGLAAWKNADLRAEREASAAQPEPMESVTVALATPREHVRTTTSIGTVWALRSVTLKNELAGTVREVALVPGAIVEAGTLLVGLDVSVEEAELAAQEAQAALAETLLGRMQRAHEKSGASEADVDRAKAERDVAKAQVARTRAIIERKTIRAPFRARVGLSDVHEGQYLNEGTTLTTLQGIDEAVHVDFSVSQDVAAFLHEGVGVEVEASGSEARFPAKIVALDARVDPSTRNAMVRARLDDPAAALTPGAAVRVRVPVGEARAAITVPVSALRKGPAGDHVFVIASDGNGKTRAELRMVHSGAMLGDEVVIESGLAAGEQVAASGSFKLREGVLVAIADPEEQRTAAR